MKKGRDARCPAPFCGRPTTTLLLLSRPSMFCLTRLAHPLQALLGAQQRGGLHRGEMPGDPGGHLYGRGGARVGSFVDDHHVVLAEAVVERKQPPAHALRQPAEGFAAVLGVLGQRSPGVGVVGDLLHVEGHGSSSSFPTRLSSSGTFLCTTSIMPAATARRIPCVCVHVGAEVCFVPS